MPLHCSLFHYESSLPLLILLCFNVRISPFSFDCWNLKKLTSLKNVKFTLDCTLFSQFSYGVHKSTVYVYLQHATNTNRIASHLSPKVKHLRSTGLTKIMIFFQKSKKIRLFGVKWLFLNWNQICFTLLCKQVTQAHISNNTETRTEITEVLPVFYCSRGYN